MSELSIWGRRDPTAVHRVQRVLAVMAHPDDADVRCGGTFAKWTAQGKEIGYVIVTSGERGGDGSRSEREVAATREAEQRAAAEVIGVRDVVFLHQEDGYLTPSIDLRRAITREIRRFRPEVVVTHNPIRHYGWGNHPDHFAVGEATASAVYPTARNPMVFPDLLEEGLAPWEVTWIMTIDAETPDHFVDIGSSIDRKIDAVRCHASQYDGHYLDFNRQIAADTGRIAGTAGYPPMEYAEAFRLRFEGHPRVMAELGGKVPG